MRLSALHSLPSPLHPFTPHPHRTQHFFFGLGAFSSPLALLWAMGDTYHYSLEIVAACAFGLSQRERLHE